MVALVGRIIVENPTKRPNNNHARHSLPARRLSRVVRGRHHQQVTAEQIVTNNVGTSLITSDEYVMNTGERASISVAIAAAPRPNNKRARRKVLTTASIPSSHVPTPSRKTRLAQQAVKNLQNRRVAGSVARRISISTEMQYRAATLCQVHRRSGVFQSVWPRHQFERASKPAELTIGISNEQIDRHDHANRVHSAPGNETWSSSRRLR